MSRNDLILTLVRAGAAGDKGLLRTTVEALAAEERAAKRTVLADRLTRAVQVNGHQVTSSTPLHGGTGVQSGQDFLIASHPSRALSELILPEVVRTEVEHLVEEQLRAELLRSHAIEPRHRVLLSGPPGNGKTALAEAIAESLALPLMTVRYETLIGSYLGETTQRLARMFEFVRSRPCVLFFDEFDAIAKERGDAHETGEIKRVVSSLLLQIDSLPSHVVAVTATNHAELLDRAVWRRFQLRLTLPAPTPAAVGRFLKCAFRSMDDLATVDTADIAAALDPVSYAEATEFVVALRRRHVLSLGQKRFAEILTEVVPLWAARSKVHVHGERSKQTASEVRPRRPRQANKRREADDPVPAKSQAKPAKARSGAKVHGASKGARGRSKPARAQV